MHPLCACLTYLAYTRPEDSTAMRWKKEERGGIERRENSLLAHGPPFRAGSHVGIRQGSSQLALHSW